MFEVCGRDQLFPSPFDKRDFELLCFDNGAKVLLCSDPETKSSAATIGFRVGAACDEFMGTAHLLEHMLFLASDKYPEEGGFKDFVSRNSGQTNAYTTLQRSIFFFDVPNPVFADALDRFLSFFACPRMIEHAVQREISAVVSEHSRNLSQEAWALQQLIRSTSSSETPYNRFVTGNVETLVTEPGRAGVSMHNVVKKFFESFFSASVLSAALYSHLPLTELRVFVQDGFSRLPTGRSVDPFAERNLVSPYLEDEYFQRIIYVKPRASKERLRIVWPIPHLASDYRKGTCLYFSHLLGHEGDGSIFALLKKRGLASALFAGILDWTSTFVVFGVDVELTSQGVLNWDAVVEITFQYISNVLRKGGLSKLHHQELRYMLQMAHFFAPKRSPLASCRNWVENMTLGLSKDQYLSGVILDVCDDECVFEDTVKYLSVERCNIFLLTSRLEKSFDLTEKYYGTSYRVERITGDLRLKWNSCSTDQALHLPQPNEYIATDFHVLPADPSSATTPTLLRRTTFGQTWHKRDHKFFLPYGFICLELCSALANSSAEAVVFFRVLAAHFEDALASLTYAADLGHLSLKVSSSKNGILVKVSGFTQKIPVLFNDVVSVLFQAFNVLDFSRFRSLLDSVSKQYTDFDVSVPANQRIKYYEEVLLDTGTWPNEDCLEVIRQGFVNQKRYTQFVKGEVFQSMQYLLFVSGNISATDAMSLAHKTEREASKVCDFVSYDTIYALAQHRMLKLAKGRTYYDRSATPADPNGAIGMMFQLGAEEPRKLCILEIFDAVVNAPLKHELRTVKELGYLVQSLVNRRNSVLSWNIQVQTERRLSLAEAYIDDFVAIKVPELLNNLTQEDFSQIVAALASSYRRQPANITEEAESHWMSISDFTFVFDYKDQVAKAFEEVRLSEVLKFYETYFSPKAPKRRNLVTRIFPGQASNTTNALAIEERLHPEVCRREHDVKYHQANSINEFQRIRPCYRAGVAKDFQQGVAKDSQENK